MEKHDWLAVCSLDGICGSFARGPDRGEVLTRLGKMLRADWGSTFKLPEKLNAALIDVNGYDEVHWGVDGFWSKDADGKTVKIDRTRPVELVEITVPKKRPINKSCLLFCFRALHTSEPKGDQTMIVPIVNLNGTSREELKEQFLEANRKAGELLKALAYAAPHARDYPKDFGMAAKEHTARLESVRQIQNEMMHLAMAVDS